MVQYTITVPNIVENALAKIAAKDGKTVQKILEEKLIYYIGCDLFDNMEFDIPVDLRRFTIRQRCEFYATYIASGPDAALQMLTAEKPV